MNKKVIIIAIVILLIIVIGVVAYTMSSSTPAPTPSAAASTAATAPAAPSVAATAQRPAPAVVAPAVVAPMPTLSAPAASATVTGGSVQVTAPIKYIRISRRTPGIVNLAEIQPYDSNNNIIPSVAIYGPDGQNADGLSGFPPGNAVDGNLNNFAHTLRDQSFIQLVLGSSTPIAKLVITNRKDCCQDRAVGLKVEFFGENGASVAPSVDINENKPAYTFEFRSSGGASSWLASRINLPQYLRHLQNKNYLLY